MGIIHLIVCKVYIWHVPSRSVAKKKRIVVEICIRDELQAAICSLQLFFGAHYSMALSRFFRKPITGFLWLQQIRRNIFFKRSKPLVPQTHNLEMGNYFGLKIVSMTGGSPWLSPSAMPKGSSGRLSLQATATCAPGPSTRSDPPEISPPGMGNL